MDSEGFASTYGSAFNEARRFSQRIGVGLVGYGLSGATFQAPIIETVDGLKLKKVVSSRPETVHRDLPNVEVASNVRELFDDPETQLIVISTPTETHYQFAKEALSADKHVVVEKPFLVHASEADELIQLAEERGTVLSIYQNRRWDNDFLTVRRCIESGLLGEIYTYEAHYDRYMLPVGSYGQRREQEAEGSGTLYDLGSHLIDQVLVLFGLPETIWADVQAQRPGSKVIDYFHMVLGYGRLRAILHSGYVVKKQGPHFAVHGDKGSFIKYGMDSQEEALLAGGRPGDPGWGEDREDLYGELTAEVRGFSLMSKVETIPGSYESFYSGIVDAISKGVAAPVEATESKNTIAIIECALQSAKEGRVVRFNEHVETL